MKKAYVVVNAAGKVFAGVSSLTRNAMWFNYEPRLIEMEGVLKFKRDPRWLALARKFDATSEWKEDA